MDKYEYNLKLDQIKTLYTEENYESAVAIADTINLSKIKNVTTLVKIGEIYEKVGRYEDCRSILSMAYDRSPIGRTIVYRLAEVAIKMKDFEAATEYYNEFVAIAPRDNSRYILNYILNKEKGAGYEELIPILEEFKKQEYTEEWAYELAYLYHKSGQSDKCIEVCDELILWFGEGMYVEYALELKMLYQPLSKAQADKYRKFRLAHQGVTSIGAEEMRRAGEYVHDPVDIPKIDVNMSKFNTVNLEQEIAKGIRQITEATKQSEVADTMDNIHRLCEEIPYLQLHRQEEDDQKAVKERNKEIDGELKSNFQDFLQVDATTKSAKREESSGNGQEKISEILEDFGKTMHAAEEALRLADQRKLESEKEKALRETGNLMEILKNDIIPKLDEGKTPRELLEEKYLGDLEIEEKDTELEKKAFSVGILDTSIEEEPMAIDIELPVYEERENPVKEEKSVLLEESVKENLQEEVKKIEEDSFDKEEPEEEFQGILVFSFRPGNPMEEEQDITWIEKTEEETFSPVIVPIYIGDIPEEEKLGALVAESSEASTPSVERQSSLSDEMTKQLQNMSKSVLQQEKEKEPALEYFENVVEEESVPEGFEEVPTEEKSLLEILKELEEKDEPVTEGVKAFSIEGEPLIQVFKESEEKDEPVTESFEEVSIEEELVPESFEEVPIEEEPVPEGFEEVPTKGRSLLEFLKKMEEKEGLVLEAFEEVPMEEEPVLGTFEEVSIKEEPVLGPFEEVPIEEEPVLGTFEEVPIEEEPVLGTFEEVSIEEEPVLGTFEEVSIEKIWTPQESADTRYIEANSQLMNAIHRSDSKSEKAFEAMEIAASKKMGTTQVFEKEIAVDRKKPVEKKQKDTVEKKVAEKKLKEEPVVQKKPEKRKAKEEPVVQKASSNSLKFSDEQKHIFTYFVPVEGMEQQIMTAVTNISKHLSNNEKSNTGNLIVQGGQASGKTVLATNVVYALQEEIGKPNNKIGKINASSLNTRDMRQLLKKVEGGCLIIEHAGDLTRETAVSFALLMEKENNGTLIILEDTSKGIKKALMLDEGFAKIFTEKISVPVFKNDDLVAFAISYAEELGYDFENMAVLALHNRISSIQKLDQATTLTEVKEIVDEAIQKEAHGGIKKAISILTAKRYSENDRIILREKDFQ